MRNQIRVYIVLSFLLVGLAIVTVDAAAGAQACRDLAAAFSRDANALELDSLARLRTCVNEVIDARLGTGEGTKGERVVPPVPSPGPLPQPLPAR